MARAECVGKRVNPATAELCTNSGCVPLNPLHHAGWDSLLQRHPESSFFHGSSWARVLNATYGHHSFYFGRTSPAGIQALLPTMEVNSWFTGRRGVCLPFTDECAAIQSLPSDSNLFDAALAVGRARGWRYLEYRGNHTDWPAAEPSLSFHSHVIPLEEEPGLLFQQFAPALRRGIRKAGDEGVQVQFDSHPAALSTFYSLHCRTRRKHGVPPQPFRFFQNIGRHVFSAGHGFVAIARWQLKPVAAAVFFHQGRQAIYKFGASDYRFQHLRPNNLLMWETIKYCAAKGCDVLHLGRTSLSNQGLRRFKLGFGAREQTLAYARYDLKCDRFTTATDRAAGPFNAFFRRLPPRLFRMAGWLLYPHLS